MSFVLAWGEAWFLDIRVIPQETEARNWIQGKLSFYLVAIFILIN